MGLLGKIFDSFIDNIPFVDDNAPRVMYGMPHGKCRKCGKTLYRIKNAPDGDLYDLYCGRCEQIIHCSKEGFEEFATK